MKAGHAALIPALVLTPPSVLVFLHGPSPKTASYLCGSPVPTGLRVVTIPHTCSYCIFCLSSLGPVSHLSHIHLYFNAFSDKPYGIRQLFPAVLNPTFYGLPGEMSKGHPYLKKRKVPETSQ